MDDWSAFPDADDGDPWADFPDASKRKKRKGKTGNRPAAPEILVEPQAIDGDTIRADDERVRLLGVDAPELSQPGYDRRGQPVPIGRQSRDFLQGEITNAGSVNLERADHRSYGRTVGPVTLDGQDAGVSVVRSGNALAAPSYVPDDGERFRLMEAERLARLNGLGPMNDTLAQAPAEYRDSPGGVPDRETIAQFWDTPTPWAGLRPEVEQRFKAMAYDPKVPLEAVVTYARENGALVDLASLKASRAYYLKHNKAGGINYTPMPEVRQELGDGSTGAGMRGFGEGFVAGGLGELGAVVDTFGGTDGRESVWNSDRRLADIWANNEFQNEAILRGDEAAHPVASTIGEVGGAITSGFVIPYGSGARTVPQLAKVGGVYGGVEGFLGTDGSVPQRLQGTVIGAPVGAVVNAVGGKALEAAIPALSRGLSAVKARLPRKASSGAAAASETAGEVGLDYTGDNLGGAINDAANRADDPWAEFPDASVGSEAPRVDGDLAAERASSAQVIGMEAEASEFISAPIRSGAPRPRALLDPGTDAERLAAAERVQPGDVLPLPSNAVDGPEDAAAAQAGRFMEAKAPNERAELSKGTVRNYMGVAVPKVGPTDLIGWLRLRGGLQDQGGELSAMGVTNAARRGLDHVGQEHRFGPLVNDEGGASLDDAAMQAWEAGYFPEMTERPTVNEFLDALRDTYEGGTGRRFLPDDFQELERFEAMRSERYDFEQQSTDGPIWQDRSNPADEPAPFPPVKAYEEWPSDAIKRVGNVDVARLDSPQDIRRALKTSYGAAGGFDAATRGRVTQAETERLASELGMTPDALLSRRKGQALNAEEALAARQILAKSGNELVNIAKRVSALDDPGDEMLAQFRQAWMRHVAIQEQVSGMTAEAGRALQQFRIAADARAVRGDVLGALVRAGGGKAGLKEAAETLIDAVEMGPGKFNALANKATKPQWRNKLSELYINMLLSNPPTHVVNMVSNSLTAMLQVPEFAAASAMGAARRAFMGDKAKDRILASEVGARTLGLLQGTKEGVRLFAQAVRTGEADDFVSKVEGDEYKAISGLKGEVIRVPTRMLTAEDQLFKGIARRMELNAQAVRIAHKEGLKGEEATRRIAELVADPTDDMLNRAMDYGRYLTFQRPLGETGQAVSRFASSNLLAKVVMPFVRTPINLLKFATERSPAAPLLKEWRKDFAVGGERRDLAIARAMLGTGLAAVIYEAALDGRITGAVPPDPKKAKLLYADGWQPYSIKVGDRYVSYSRLDPLSTTIGVAADMATLPSGLSDRQQDDAGTMLVASIMGNLASKTWLSGVSSFVEGLADPGRNAEGWIQRTVGAFTVPAGVAGVARAIDPISRKREDVGDAIKARVPGMSDDLLPRRDVFGEVLVGDSLGPDFLSPFWQTKAKNDPVVAEMLRIEKGVSAPSKQFSEDGERVDYTPEQYDRYHEVAGRLTYNSLLGLVGSREYADLDDAGKRRAAQKAIAKARKSAREVLDDPDYPLPDKGAVMEQDEWSAFPSSDDKGDAWESFPDAPSRDVVADLSKAIPGIRFTSGFRTPEYNASLRARGYNPADNSEHLDGAALDMLPPPGQSLGWLRREVARYDPKARLLIHDGHLHGGFNGYYKAPKLGGMAGQ